MQESQQERLDYLQESLDAEVEARYSMDESFDGAFEVLNRCLNSHNEGLASLQTLLVGVEKKLRADFEAERAAKDAKIAALEARIAAQDAEIAEFREGMAELRDLFAGISVQEGQDQQQEE